MGSGHHLSQLCRHVNLKEMKRINVIRVEPLTQLILLFAETCSTYLQDNAPYYKMCLKKRKAHTYCLAHGYSISLKNKIYRNFLGTTRTQLAALNMSLTKQPMVAVLIKYICLTTFRPWNLIF